MAQQNTIPNRFICSLSLVGYNPSKIKLNRHAYEYNQKNIINQIGKAVPAFNGLRNLNWRITWETYSYFMCAPNEIWYSLPFRLKRTRLSVVMALVSHGYHKASESLS